MYYLAYAAITFALFGAAAAKALGREPWSWGMISLLLGPLGIALVCLAGRVDRRDREADSWTALKLVDADIAAAAAKASEVNREKLLMQIYLAAGDKAYLDRAVEVALQDAAEAATIKAGGWRNANSGIPRCKTCNAPTPTASLSNGQCRLCSGLAAS